MSSLFLCGSLGRWLLLVGGGEECVRVCEWVQLSAVTQGGGRLRSQLHSIPLLSGPVIGQLKLGEMLTAEVPVLRIQPDSAVSDRTPAWKIAPSTSSAFALQPCANNRAQKERSSRGAELTSSGKDNQGQQEHNIWKDGGNWKQTQEPALAMLKLIIPAADRK